MANDNPGQTGGAESFDLQGASEAGFVDYFSTPARQGLIQQLLHLIRFGDGIPVVQGAGRSGKTAIARQLKFQLEDVPHLALVEVKSDTPLLVVLMEVLRQYGFSVGDTVSEGELLAELRRFAQALNSDQSLGVLILDNAHCLDDQSLGALVSLLQGTDTAGYGLHLVFFAQPDLVSRIDDLGLLDISVYDFDIPLMSPSELSDFLKRHLESRQEGGGKLSAETVQAIWSRSRGAPGYSLRLMFEMMRSDAPDSKTRLASWPVGHLVALSVLMGVLAWALLARNTNPEPEPKVVAEVSLPDAMVRANLEAEPDTTAGSRFTEYQPQLDDRLNAPQEPRNPPKVEMPNVEMGNKELSGASGASNINDPAKEALVKETLVKETLVKEILVVDQTSPRPKTPINLDRPPVTAEALPSPKIEPAPTINLKETASRWDDLYTADEKFLLDQNPSNYVLQIMVASQKEALEGFVDKQANRDSLFSYRGLRGGKSLYILTAGVYANRAAAVEAIAKLPAEQKKGGPWPRQLQDIQREIKEDRSK